MKKIALFFTLIFCAANIYAQQIPVTTANYELAERFSPAKVERMVYSQTITPNWFPSSNKFWYQWKDADGTKYFVVDPEAKTKTELFNMDYMAMQITQITGDPFDAQYLPIRSFRLTNDRIFTFEIQSTLEVDEKLKEGDTKKPKKVKKVFKFEYDYISKQLTDISDREESKRYPTWANIAPDSSAVIYVKGYDVYYMDMDNLKKLMEDEKASVTEHRLTTDGIKDFAWGGSRDLDTTNRRFYAGAVWSPDSKKFLMTKANSTMVKDMWVINVLAMPRPKLETYKYQMPGEPGAITHLALFNMEDKSHKYLDVDAYKEQTLAISRKPISKKDRFNKYNSPQWLGDNSTFYLTRKSRDLKRVDICKVNVETGNVENIAEERLNTYIETRGIRLINNGTELIQWSERNGWAHLYLYDTSNGTLKNAITTGAFHVDQILGVDEKARVVYFSANGFDKEENPYYLHIFKARLDGGNIELLNPGNFDNLMSLTEDTKFFVNSASRVDTAPTNALYNNMGKKVMDLETADFSELLKSGYKFPETFVVKAADGVTDLHGVMYKPYDFDPKKKYPIIQYVYPGPQTEGTNYFWSSRMDRIDRLAQVGFIVVAVGNRGGHPDRSKRYHNYGYGNLRDYGLADQKYAVQQLAARHPFIDGKRVGIHGHSGGGFMSTAALLTYPDFYTAAVSSAGNHDNRIYNRWWSETHHGVKEVITEKGDTTFQYSIDVNQELAKNLKGRLLLVHGDMDNNVHPGNTTRVVDALIKANKRFDMIYLPGQRHAYGNMTEYFFWALADYFAQYLIGDYEDTVDISQMNNN